MIDDRNDCPEGLSLNSFRKVYRISEITREIRSLIENTWPAIWIEGEISNLKTPASGHMYFTLKDSSSQIQAVFFSYRGRVSFPLKDGLKVIVLGSLSVYERGGNYQIIVQKVEPLGLGSLQLAFEELKKKLKEKGYFDDSKKKQIPLVPSKIGVVTSATGAAICDMLNVLNRRFADVHLILNPVRVQGEGSEKEIARAIDEFNEMMEVDVLIVGRGGGSLEDLWAFNTAEVAESIYRSKIPVISAVGHEIDWTISDFVADLRVPTPSAAAERVIIARSEIVDRISFLQEHITTRIKRQLERLRSRLVLAEKSRIFSEPVSSLRQYRQLCDDLYEKMCFRVKLRLEKGITKIGFLSERLNSLSPLNVLKRGYSVTYFTDEKKLVRDAGSLAEGDNIVTRLNKGKIKSTVKQIVLE